MEKKLMDKIKPLIKALSAHFTNTLKKVIGRLPPVAQLIEQVATLNKELSLATTQINQLESKINQLESKINQLESQVYILGVNRSSANSSIRKSAKFKPAFIAGSGFSDNLKYAYLFYVNQYGNDSATLLTFNNDTYQALTNVNLNCVLWEGIENGDAIEVLLSASVIVTDTHIVPHGGYGAEFCTLIQNKPCINLWHGIPLKDIGRYYRVPDKIIQTNVIVDSYRNWHFLLPSFEVLALFENYYPNATFHVGRYPRNLIWDYPETKGAFINVDMDAIEKLKNKVSDSVNVIFCPTFRDTQTDLIEHYNLIALDQLLAQTNIKLFLKFHAYDHGSTLPDDVTFSSITIIDRQTDVYPLLVYCDILITDLSSILFDFALLDKPIFLIKPKTESDKLQTRLINGFANHLVQNLLNYPSLEEWLTKFQADQPSMLTLALQETRNMRKKVYEGTKYDARDTVSAWIHAFNESAPI